MTSLPQQLQQRVPHHYYQVEHLATFSTAAHQQPTTPKVALQRLFAMEKTSGIWTQRMALQIEGSHMLIIDGETNEVVERFPVSLIQQPTAFNHPNHIYNNILILTVQHPDENQGELHIFQCVSNSAQQIVEELNHWMRRHGNNHINDSGTHHVKETVSAFNAIAAQRDKKSVSPVGSGNHPRGAVSSPQGVRDHDSRSVTTTSSVDSNHHNGAHRTNSQDQRYVSILNHCFDDIERFIIRLQHAAAALRELQLRNHKRQGKGAGDGLLAIRARGPSEEEFFEILSKFKLAFNLLAKLKGCIHDPNAPELVHFLFTPLAIIIEAARSNGPTPVDPSLTGIPYLNSEAIDLLSNCCTSKEFDLWQSLGPNWTQPIKQHVVQPSTIIPASFQPVFTDGWAPTINEPELMGFTSSSEQSEHEDDSMPIPVHIIRDGTPIRREQARIEYGRRTQSPNFDDSDIDDHNSEQHRRSPIHRGRPNQAPSPIDSIERESPTGMQLNDLEQSEWLSELQNRNAKIVRVLFPRTANNDKELTVVRGEILEVLDDSRKWWKARNWRNQVAHVPHTIVSEIADSNGFEISRDSPNGDWIRRERQVTDLSVDTPTQIQKSCSASYINNKIGSKEESLSSPQNGSNQYSDFHSELTATLRSRSSLGTRKSVSPSASDLGSKSNYQMNETYLMDYLLNKGFNHRIMTSFLSKGWDCKTILNLSKEQLKSVLEINEAEQQRLHSHLLLLRNLHSNSKQDDQELLDLLQKRRSKSGEQSCL